jgi:ABC-type polysaccharide/polyol phosphate transport system ATPase subunit
MRSEIGGDVAIAFENVSKHYSLALQKEASDFKTMLLHLPRFLSNARRPFVALDNVNLRVKRGESLGIIGPNGSGKSTTLRVMSGITPPTSGKVTINGRVSALLELGSGFHPQITGRENAILNAVLLGLTLGEARAMLPRIVEFSELGQFIDQPMRTYSSGMFFRLGFSVAVHVDPEILLIDEVLAVGDAEFQKKCMDHIHGLRAKGVTLVLVTHDMLSMPLFCDRAVLVEHGQLTDEGTPQQVVHNYLARVEALLALRSDEQEELKLAQAAIS